MGASIYVILLSDDHLTLYWGPPLTSRGLPTHIGRQCVQFAALEAALAGGLAGFHQVQSHMRSPTQDVQFDALARAGVRLLCLQGDENDQPLFCFLWWGSTPNNLNLDHPVKKNCPSKIPRLITQKNNV